MKRNHLIVLILTMVLLSGCAAPPVTSTPTPTPAQAPAATPSVEATPTPRPSPTPGLTPALAEIQGIKNVIRTEVEGIIVRYARESFWSDNAFSAILENKAEFKSEQVQELANTVSVLVKSRRTPGRDK